MAIKPSSTYKGMAMLGSGHDLRKNILREFQNLGSQYDMDATRTLLTYIYNFIDAEHENDTPNSMIVDTLSKVLSDAEQIWEAEFELQLARDQAADE